MWSDYAVTLRMIRSIFQLNSQQYFREKVNPTQIYKFYSSPVSFYACIYVSYLTYITLIFCAKKKIYEGRTRDTSNKLHKVEFLFVTIMTKF